MPEQVSDAILLERFVSRREEAAFVALVQRHGPLVQGICRRVLRNEHDVEDVSRPRFSSWREERPESRGKTPLGDGWAPWLVDWRWVRGRTTLAQQRRETPFATLAQNGSADVHGHNRFWLPEKYHPLTGPSAELERHELRRVLDDELLRLPEKYRAPVVLCDLEGRTHEEAARQLGYPAGSMSRRLARARALLRRRLIHRGISLAIGLFALGLVYLAAWSIPHRNENIRIAIRRAMFPLKPFGEGANGARDNARPDPPRSTRFRQSRPGQQPGTANGAGCGGDRRSTPSDKNRTDWRAYAIEMRRSASVLAQATQKNDTSAMLAAARRLDASCLKCHEVFRRPSERSDGPWDSHPPGA